MPQRKAVSSRGDGDRRRGGLLRHRDFRLLWTGETISEAGDSLANVLVPLLAVTILRARTFDVAALTTAAYLPWLLIGLPAGAWVDRWRPRPLMIACDAVSALAFASLPVAAWLGVLSFWHLAAVVFLAGVADVFFTTAYTVYLPSIVAPGDLVEGNAKLQGSASAAVICGRAAAGALAQAAGAAAAVGLNAASFLVSAACLLRIGGAAGKRQPTPAGTISAGRPAAGTRTTGTRTTGTRTTGTRTTIRAEVAEGVRFIAADPRLRAITGFAVTGNFAYTGYTSLAVLFLVRGAGFGSATVGVLMAVAGVGGVAGALVTGWLARRVGSARVLLLAAAANVAGLLIPLAHPGLRVIWYLVGAVVVNAGMLVGNITVGAFRQQYCPPDMMGRMVTSMRFLAWGVIPLSALLAGALGTALGVRDALWIFLAANVVTGVFLCAPSLQAARDLPSRAMAEDVGA